jgi:flagellar M-ring protein FliF
VDQFRRILAVIQTHLGRMTPAHRLLVGSGAVILVMALLLVSQYAGRADMVQLLPGLDQTAQDRAYQYLQTSRYEPGRDFRQARDGTVHVAATHQRVIRAELAQSRSLPGDTRLLFDNLLEHQKMGMSRDQIRQASDIALQNELAMWIGRFNGIREASVFIEVPPPGGIASRMRRGAAGVTVLTEDGRPLNQQTVDAIAHLVANSRAGLDVSDVRVIDGTNNTQHRASDEDQIIPTTRREYAKAIEDEFVQKIHQIVGHIQGVAVVVTADVDVSRSEIREMRFLPRDAGSIQLLGSEVISETEDSSTASGAEPGVRSNTPSDINRGGGEGRRSSTFDSEVAMDNRFGTREEHRTDPRGQWTMLAATVGVPRGWIAGLLRHEADPDDPAAAPRPTDEQIQARFEIESERIRAAIRHHLRAWPDNELEREGDVQVTLMPVDYPVIGPSGQAAGLVPGSGGVGGLLRALDGGSGGRIVDKLILASLALLAVGMMLVMVRKAARRSELPSAEELVGIPPALATQNDLVGEADETDSPMPGIEVAESEVKRQKVLEEVVELVQKEPGAAAKLMGRWITDEV